MMDWRGIFVLIFGILFVSDAAPPSITSVPTPALRSDRSYDVTAQSLEVSDPDGDTFTCAEDPVASVPFTVDLAQISTGYLMTFTHTDPTALTASQYTVTISCTDVNAESSSADVTVSITSNSPPRPVTAAVETVTVDVSTTFLPQSVLHTLAVNDPDGDPLTCTATPPAGFTVDTNDCTIRNSVDLRSLALTSSELIQISVSDGVNPPVDFERTLSFVNPNQAPVFSALPSDVSVPEDVTPGDTLIQFDVTDTETFARTLTADSGAALFDFSSATGEVKLASGQSFDYETGTRTFVLTCVADDSFFQSTASVTLSIVDANDAPTLSPASVAVTADEGPPGSLSASLPITVSDEDGTGPATHAFSVLPGGAFSSYFNFPDPHVPTLSNLLALDREGSPPSPVTIEIVVTDAGGKTATAKVVVTLTDVNDNDPSFVVGSLTMNSVYEGMAAGTSLGKIRATDADEGTNQDVEFSLVTPNAHPGLFDVQANGKVSLLMDLTETYGTALSLEVMAKDKGLPSRSSTTVITLDWNKPPSITNLPGTSDVPEDPTVEKLLFTLVTSDPENDVVTCQVSDVTPTGTGSGSFVVRTIPGTSDQGVYYTAAEALSRGVIGSYDVTVTASDGKGGQSSAVLTVEVTPNTPPTSSCVGSASATVDVQTDGVGTVVKALTVTDNENDVISFTMTSVPNSGSFRFDEGTREVLVARDLRLEPAVAHQLTIDVSDGLNAAVTCTLFVTLTNINSPPLFASHNAIVPVDEHVAALASLFAFDVTDTEAFSVSWTVGPLSDAGFFTLDDTTREIKLASGQAFDYESKTRQFIITCTADDGFLQSSSSVTLTILDSNDPPYFLASTVQVTVDEGPAPTISFLPAYNAVDPDSDTLTYALVAGGTYTDLFTINSVDGTLTNQLTLDRDEGAPNPIAVQVEVKDPSGQSATVDVTIFLNDINDNTPVFSQASYQFKVGLSTARGTELGNLTVTDKDDGTNAQVDLVLTNQIPPGYMTLEPDGRLFLTRDLTLDYGTLFTLTVEARDNGNPARTATVVAEVVWNEGPKIHNLPSVAYIHEDVATKTPIFDLSVTDLESDQYTCVKGDIVPATLSFDVEETGNKNFKVIYTGTGKLSSTTKPQYELSVRCHDVNGEALKKLTISVRSNTAPTLPCNPTASISVDALATDQDMTVYTVQATDAEQDPLEYAISSSGVFFVTPYSGEIKTRLSLRMLTTDQYSLDITVSDPKHTTYCTLVVYLTNINKAPVFANLDHTVEIPENTAAGSVLYVISVTDPNIFGANIGITWSSANKYKFELVVSGLTATVKLAAGEELDYEANVNTFTLRFVASDGYLTSEEKTLTIQVTPVNEPPYFEKNILNYYATFKETASPPEIKALGCNVIDPDADDVVTLTLAGTYADLFSIADLDNCQLSLISEFDLDNGATSPATLTMTATDRQGEKAEATVVVTIEEINDNDPIFDGPQQLTIGLGMVAGDPIGSATATDQDQGTDGAISYSIATSPLNSVMADKYITFLSTGKFVLRQSMDNVIGSGENFQYVIRATDYGVPPRTATTTVNVVYDPYLNTTTTEATQTTSPMEPVVTSDAGSLLAEPLVIGLLATLICVAGVLCAVAVWLACKYCGNQSSSGDYIKSSRPSSPAKTNKISVSTIESGYSPLSGSSMAGFESRKVSSLLPPVHY